MMFVSIASVVTNLIIVINIIVSVADPDRSALSVILLTIIADVLGAILILVLFNPASTFSEGHLLLSPTYFPQTPSSALPDSHLKPVLMGSHCATCAYHLLSSHSQVKASQPPVTARFASFEHFAPRNRHNCQYQATHPDQARFHFINVPMIHYE